MHIVFLVEYVSMKKIKGSLLPNAWYQIMLETYPFHSNYPNQVDVPFPPRDV